MAGRKGTLTKSAISVADAATDTLLQIVAAANHAVRITRWHLSAEGVVNTDDPVLVELLRQTDAGTATALTPKKLDDSIADTLDTTGQHTATVEPTAGDILRSRYVHPQSGIDVPDDIIVGVGDRVGLRVTNATGVALKFTAEIEFEE